MHKILVYILLVTVIGRFSINNFVYAQDYQGKVLEKKDIIIYQLSSEEGKNHFKAVYFVDAKESDFIKMLLNPENHKQWLSNVKKAENISNQNDSVIYTRIVLSVNTLFKKEAIVKTSVSHNSKNNITNIIQEVDHSSEQETKYKNFNDFKADWKIRKIKDNKIEVELYFLGIKDDSYPEFINNFLESIFIKKLYKLAYRSRNQANKNEW